MSELLFAGCDEHVKFAGGLRDILNRDDIVSEPNAMAFGSRIVELLQDLLGSIDLPPKETVLAGVGTMLDRIFAVVDVPGPDPVIEPLIKATVLAVVGQLYDRFAKE
ncbi:MAG: hypothetical protein AAGG48_14620 [Planctomycetota bacterium]